jgi:hypothetical protein
MLRMMFYLCLGRLTMIQTDRVAFERLSGKVRGAAP